MRENIRKQNKGNSFYDVFKKRSYRDQQNYNVVAGLSEAQFTRRKREENK